MDDTVLREDSIVQKIWYSHVFTAWFERHAAKASDGRRVRNLRAAKHRFESFSKPLGRLILWLPAVLATAHDIAVKRAGENAAKIARRRLENITAEKLLTLAMLVDAGDEGLALVRQVDDEQVDLASVQRYVSEFLARSHCLWTDSQCLAVEGYTKHCMEFLDGGLQFFTGDGESLRELRRPPPATLDRCLQRMRCYLKVAEEVLAAEYPHCHLLRAFSAFDLRDVNDKDLAANARNLSTHQENLERLAHAFKVPGGGAMLRAQLADHQPIAASIAKETRCDNRVAWQRALERTQKTHVSKQTYPASALGPVLQRYVAWTASSSGVEQNFAIAERLRLINTPASEAKEAESLKAPLDKRPAEHLEVTARAQEIYADVFGAARPNRTGARLDKGVKNKSKLPRHRLVRTEAEWLRRRRADVAATALGQRHALVAEPIQPDLNARPAGWTDAHEAVLCKQRKKPACAWKKRPMITCSWIQS